ncbi:CHC2 zinc finger domain-containing protein [Butyrivibrio sp. INlla16]|uniref:CHC2 zinc finger domain-containing protein n=1 Tax=Butyrivibrio sp. INlla16 TaxID=1520807 RepID=UPI000881317B|nr:CHC2 zinc finger domain-containing protein [Butyrivibrio sp. INlla16]SDB45679.1 CHC2 zinc finger [Butyrivibrio sp. INlla16]
MSVFTAVKANVTARQVAEHAGIRINRNGMAICPFHDDHNPSLKIDDRYYCFGCGAKGDAVDFEANYYGLGLKDAALKIAEDFGISVDDGCSHGCSFTHMQPKESSEHRFIRLRNECINQLKAYSVYLHELKDILAPRYIFEDFSDEYVETIKTEEYINYLLDLMYGFEYCTREDQEEIIRKNENGEFNYGE